MTGPGQSRCLPAAASQPARAGRRKLADEDDITTAVEAVYGNIEARRGYRPCTDGLVDEAAVRDQLAADGYAGCGRRDLNPNNDQEHDTVRIWGVEHLTITGVDEIGAA